MEGFHIIPRRAPCTAVPCVETLELSFSSTGFPHSKRWRTTKRSSGGTCSTSPGCGREPGVGKRRGLRSAPQPRQLLAGGDGSELERCPAAGVGTAGPGQYKGCHTHLGFQGPPGQWVAQVCQSRLRAREGTRYGFAAGTAEPRGREGFPPSLTKAKLTAHPGQVYGGHSAPSACWRCPSHLLLPSAQQSRIPLGSVMVGWAPTWGCCLPTLPAEQWTK